MKIFEFNQGQKGTLIDSVSKTAGTLTAGTGGFKKTEKGLAMLFDGVHTKIDTNLAHTDLDLTGNITIEAWIKPYSYGGGGIYVGGNIINNGKLVLWMREHTNTFTISSNYPKTSIHSSTISINKYLHLLITRTSSGVTNFYIDNSLSGSADQYSGTPESGTNDLFIGNDSSASKSYDGCIAKVRIYDHVLSEQERNTLYEQFLQASPTEKPIRGFEYPKPTDLSYESGLVAAYNMIPNGNTLVDISGNGNELALTNITTTKEGINFNGAGNASRATSYDLGTVQTITFRGSVNSPALDGIISDGTNYLRITNATSFTSFFGGGANNFTIPALSNNTLYSFVFVRNGTNCRLYIDGSLVGEYTSTGNSNLGLRFIGSAGSSVQYWSKEMTDMRIYNYAFTPEQAKAYHNSFVKPVLIEDFSNYAVGDTNPKGWIAGTGAYKISESVDKGKYLECITAGTAAIQSKNAYGEWEFSVLKGADGNSHYVAFISNSIGGESETNGYTVKLTSLETIAVRKNNIGSITDLFITAASYIANNTWYRLKIARLQSEGVFKDISTLQVSNMVNRSSLGYTTFTSNGRYGFSASATASGSCFAGTADELPIMNTAKYLVEFDLKLNSGTAPSIRIMEQLASGTISNTVVTTNGRNSIILTATSTTTGVLEFFNTTATDYEVSGLQIRRIYDANSFAVFIKGGAYGNTETGWTLVDTTGGSGTNPVTDSTYKTSNYLVADLDAGDRIANIKINNGIKL